MRETRNYLTYQSMFLKLLLNSLQYLQKLLMFKE